MHTRERLQTEIESTRIAFHQLVESIPDEALELPSANPAWNIRQVLYHIAVIPRYMIVEVMMISRQVRLYQLIPKLVSKRFFDWMNVRMTRLGARDKTCADLVRLYDISCHAAQEALEKVRDDDFTKSLFYPLWDPLLTGDVTVEYLFGYVKRHFDSHSGQILDVVKNRSGDD